MEFDPKGKNLSLGPVDFEYQGPEIELDIGFEGVDLEKEERPEEDLLNDDLSENEEDLEHEELSEEFLTDKFRESGVPKKVDILGIYFGEATKHPILSREEEVLLAKAYEKGKKANKNLKKLNGKDLKAAKNLELTINQGKHAREKLFLYNQRLVVSIAKRERGLTFIDRIQNGNLGLHKAIEKYDYKLGTRFSTYATWWIRQSMEREKARADRTIRVPLHRSDLINKVYGTLNTLRQILNKEPTFEELATELKMAPEKMRKLLEESFSPLSLDMPLGEDGDLDLGMTIKDDDLPDEDAQIMQDSMKEEVRKALKELDNREAQILRLRHGFDGAEPTKLEDIGRDLGITRERVRQIESVALGKLRHPRIRGKLRGYL